MPKHPEQFNVRLDEQAKADARTIARRYGLNSMGAAIRHALHEVARGLQERKMKKRLEIPVMSAKELWDELKQLRKERPDDFDDLAIYVEVVDRESYELEQKATADDEGVTEYTSAVLAEGSAYAFQVHTPFDRGGKQGDDYVLIAAVELE